MPEDKKPKIGALNLPPIPGSPLPGTGIPKDLTIPKITPKTEAPKAKTRTFSPEVERWRPLVSKYFRPEDVDKALYVISYESGGNPKIVGDGGASIGLFQLNAQGLGSGMSVIDRENGEKNIQKAANAVYSGRGWADWGEGTENMAPYDPKTGRGKFGALGNHPYTGWTNAPLTGLRKPKVPSTQQAKPVSGVNTSRFTSSGDYDQDILDTLAQIEELYEELENHYDPDAVGEEDLYTVEGLKILSKINILENRVVRLDKAKKIFGANDDAAKSWVESERGKEDSALKQYEDFRKRVGDVVELDTLPGKLGGQSLDRQQAVTSNKLVRDKAVMAGEVYPTQGYMDYGVNPNANTGSYPGIADAVRSTIPAQAPQPYIANPAAYEGLRTPDRKPLIPIGNKPPPVAPQPNIPIGSQGGPELTSILEQFQKPDGSYFLPVGG